jgi:hypothetical protein
METQTQTQTQTHTDTDTDNNRQTITDRRRHTDLCEPRLHHEHHEGHVKVNAHQAQANQAPKQEEEAREGGNGRIEDVHGGKQEVGRADEGREPEGPYRA